MEDREDTMEKTVVISVRAKQEYHDLEPENMDMITLGLMRCEDGAYHLAYPESDMTGMKGTITTIQVDNGGKRVVLMRVGTYNSQMIFEEGQRHLSVYQTPYGDMAVGINTRNLDAKMDEHGGTIEIDYMLEIQHAVMGRNRFSIEVRESENDQSLKYTVFHKWFNRRWENDV